MKTFIPHNRWVMTAALLAVLGLNMSYSDKTSREGFSAEFASSENIKEGKIPTAKGVVKVRYVKDEESDKVTALVKTNAEGDFCVDCEAKAITISAQNFNDIELLNSDLLAKIQESKKEEASTLSSRDEVRGDDDNGVANNVLEDILDLCENKDDDSERLTCLSNKFVSALQKNVKIKDPDHKDYISNADAEDFYKTHIHNLIRSEVDEARELAVKKYRAFTGRDGESLYDLDPETDLRDSEDVMQAALEAIQHLHEGIPTSRSKDGHRRFQDLRRKLIDTEKTVVAQHAKAVKQAMAAAEANKNSINYSSYLAEAQLLNRSLPEVIRTLKATTTDGLNGAIDNQYLRSAAAKDHLTDFVLHSSSIQNSMNKFMNDWAVTGRIDSTGIDTIPVGIDLNGRITGTVNRGGVVLVPSSSVSSRVSSRTGLNELFVGDQNYLQTIQPNNGIEFSPLVPLTPENAARRDELVRSRIMINRGL